MSYLCRTAKCCHVAYTDDDVVPSAASARKTANGYGRDTRPFLPFLNRLLASQFEIAERD